MGLRNINLYIDDRDECWLEAAPDQGPCYWKVLFRGTAYVVSIRDHPRRQIDSMYLLGFAGLVGMNYLLYVLRDSSTRGWVM